MSDLLGFSLVALHRSALWLCSLKPYTSYAEPQAVTVRTHLGWTLLCLILNQSPCVHTIHRIMHSDGSVL